VIGWAELTGTPPLDQLGFWSPPWKAAVAVALAHLVGDAAAVVPHGLFRPDRRVFFSAQERLAPVRPPWLDHVYERVQAHPYREFA
jgi:hypothetical protein